MEILGADHVVVGVEYGSEDVFDLTSMQPYNLEKLHKSFTQYTDEVVLYLPRNSDLNQIARYAKDEKKKLEVAHYAIMGSSKVRVTSAVWEEFSTDLTNCRLSVYTLGTSSLMWMKNSREGIVNTKRLSKHVML